MFLRIVGWLLTDYKALYPRRFIFVLFTFQQILQLFPHPTSLVSWCMKNWKCGIIEIITERKDAPSKYRTLVATGKNSTHSHGFSKDASRSPAIRKSDRGRQVCHLVEHFIIAFLVYTRTDTDRGHTKETGNRNATVISIVTPTDEAVLVRSLLYLILLSLYVDIFYILGDEHRYGLLEENKWMNEFP
jgi:hypothetical protein